MGEQQPHPIRRCMNHTYVHVLKHTRNNRFVVHVEKYHLTVEPCSPETRVVRYAICRLNGPPTGPATAQGRVSCECSRRKRLRRIRQELSQSKSFNSACALQHGLPTCCVRGIPAHASADFPRWRHAGSYPQGLNRNGMTC